MSHTENICELCAKALNSSTKVEYDGKTINFKAPWPRLSMLEAINTLGRINLEVYNLIGHFRIAKIVLV